MKLKKGLQTGEFRTTTTTRNVIFYEKIFFYYEHLSYLDNDHSDRRKA